MGGALDLTREQAGRLLDTVYKYQGQYVHSGSRVWGVNRPDSDQDIWVTKQLYAELRALIESYGCDVAATGYQSRAIRFVHGERVYDIVAAYDQYDFNAVVATTQALQAPALGPLLADRNTRVLLFRQLQNQFRYLYSKLPHDM